MATDCEMEISEGREKGQAKSKARAKSSLMATF